MFKFIITQTVMKDQVPIALLEWGEDQVERGLLHNTPPHLQHIVIGAWRRTINDFKKESIKL